MDAARRLAAQPRRRALQRVQQLVATAQALAAEGARVIVADIDREGGEKSAATLRESGAQAEFVAVDMTDTASIAVAAVVMLAVSVLAAYGPARRVLRIDPAQMLRR